MPLGYEWGVTETGRGVAAEGVVPERAETASVVRIDR